MFGFPWHPNALFFLKLLLKELPFSLDMVAAGKKIKAYFPLKFLKNAS